MSEELRKRIEHIRHIGEVACPRDYYELMLVIGETIANIYDCEIAALKAQLEQERMGREKLESIVDKVALRREGAGRLPAENRQPNTRGETK